MTGIGDTFKNLLFEDEEEKSPARPANPPAGTFAPAVASANLTLGTADSEKVKKLVAKACAGSAILGQFMIALDRAAKYFANDEAGRVRSALSNMDADKSAIVVEITRASEQGLASIRAEVETARKGVYDAQVGTLERSLQAAHSEIAQLQAALATKQQSIAPMEAQIQAAREELARRDAVTTASLTEAERFLGRLKQNVEQL